MSFESQDETPDKEGDRTVIPDISAMLQALAADRDKTLRASASGLL